MRRGVLPATFLLLLAEQALLETEALTPPKLCQGQLAISGADASFVKGSGGNASGDVLTLAHDAGLSILKVCDEASWDPFGFIAFKLLGKKLTFTVDLSKVGCACNLALYLISEPALDLAGAPLEAGDDAPDFCEGSPYYCDANKVCGSYCPEIDIMEANNHVFSSTPHSCDPPDAAGHYTACDTAGCGGNTKDLPGEVYGPGDQFLIDTRQPFQVETSFLGSVSPPKFDGFATKLLQGSNVVDLDHAGCAPAVDQLTEAMEKGMAMRITYWGDKPDTMEWLDAPVCHEEKCSGSNTGMAFISTIQVEDLLGATDATTPAPATLEPTLQPTPAPTPSTTVQTLPPATPAPTTTTAAVVTQSTATPTPVPTTATPTPAPTMASTVTTTTVVQVPYDCDDHFDNWQLGWSDGKKQWCCAEVSRGCEELGYEMVIEQQCPSGYSDIITEAECNRARQSLGIDGWRAAELSKSSDRLPYCWVGAGGMVNFNPAGDTGDTWRSAQGVLCRVMANLGGDDASDSATDTGADQQKPPPAQCSVTNGSEPSSFYPCACVDEVCDDGQLCLESSGDCRDGPSFIDAALDSLGAAMSWLGQHWWMPLAITLAGVLVLLPRMCPGAPCISGAPSLTSPFGGGWGSRWAGGGSAAEAQAPWHSFMDAGQKSVGPHRRDMRMMPSTWASFAQPQAPQGDDHSSNGGSWLAPGSVAATNGYAARGVDPYASGYLGPPPQFDRPPPAAGLMSWLCCLRSSPQPGRDPRLLSSAAPFPDGFDQPGFEPRLVQEHGAWRSGFSPEHARYRGLPQQQLTPEPSGYFGQDQSYYGPSVFRPPGPLPQYGQLHPGPPMFDGGNSYMSQAGRYVW